MRTGRTVEAEWKQVLRASVSTGTKEDDSSTWRVWVVGFDHVTAHSHFARTLNLMTHLFI
jgi:hypothetical protein